MPQTIYKWTLNHESGEKYIIISSCTHHDAMSVHDSFHAPEALLLVWIYGKLIHFIPSVVSAGGKIVFEKNFTNYFSGNSCSFSL